MEQFFQNNKINSQWRICANKSHHKKIFHEKAYYENRLSGILKELVATLDEEEDYNVFMFVHFKKNNL